MNSVNDLRRALAGEVNELGVDLSIDAVTGRARSLRRRRTALSSAAAATFVVVVSAAVWLPGGGTGAGLAPGGEPAVITHPSVHPSFPVVGDSIGTGLMVGADEEFILWFTVGMPPGPGEWAQLTAGIRNTRTGHVDLVAWQGQDVISPNHVTPGRWQTLQLACEDGRVIDYGIFVGRADRITVSSSGEVTEASWTRWSRDPQVVVFWAERRGTPLPDPTGGSQPSNDPQRPQLTAYRNGEILGTAAALNVSVNPSTLPRDTPGPDLSPTG